MKHADLSSYIHHGVLLMYERDDDRARKDKYGAIWALLCEAAQISLGYPAPPRTGYPAKSSAMDGPDSVTEWQRAVFAHEEGLTVTQLYGLRPRIQYTAAQHTYAQVTLDLFHRHAFRLSGKRRQLQRAVFAHACGAPPRKVRALTGLSRLQLHRAREQACREMLAGME